MRQGSSCRRRRATAATSRRSRPISETAPRGPRAAARLRNFRPDAGSYLASLGGPLPYMARLREIDALTTEHEQR